MDSPKKTWVVALGDIACLEGNMVGGKATSLTKLINADVPVPRGFCLTVSAYQHFLAQSDLLRVIQMELGRKQLDNMRWEEIWDAALRIRLAFLRAPLSTELVQAIYTALTQLNSQRHLAVRSSAPGEDSAHRSFAGLHESIVNVQDTSSVLQAVRTVWASLWSDAALLYRKELALDPLQSRMAVIVQEMVPADISGVAFARDPRNQAIDREIIEAVRGPCSNLVDGLVEPDRWILQRSSGKVVHWQAGERDLIEGHSPLLNDHELRELHSSLRRIEELFGWPPDMEWAEQGSTLSVLQARPITSGGSTAQSDDRRWYLTLRPKFSQLRRLAEKVSQSLIPELDRLGHQLAEENIDNLEDRDLADCIEKRLSALAHWREIYKAEFIPLAHGIRYLGAYYNDALQPPDPYEFLGLLEGQDFLASHRNTAIGNLAQRVNQNPTLRKTLTEPALNLSPISQESWGNLKEQINTIHGGADFLIEFEQFLQRFMDTCYNGERLIERPASLFGLICQLGTVANEPTGRKEQNKKAKALALEKQLIEAVGHACEEEARQIIAIGQLSWRLRDDDNILLGRIESQFLRALHLGARRLCTSGRLSGKLPSENSASLVTKALRNSNGDSLHIDEDQQEPIHEDTDHNDKPRQLIGQPASPGLAEGTACVINGIEDFPNFHHGEILVCESIQPTMTHLVPLASAIVERRGAC